MSRGRTDTFTLFFLHETERAIRVAESENDDEGFWLPKSQVEYEDGVEPGDWVDVEIPEWLAKDKGLT